MSAKSALKLLRNAAPELDADFDHLFEPAGGPLAPIGAALAAAQGGAGVGGRELRLQGRHQPCECLPLDLVATGVEPLTLHPALPVVQADAESCRGMIRV